MTDMRARFHRADNLQPPDLWTEVLQRAAAAPARRTTARPAVRVVLVLVGLLLLAAVVAAVGALVRTPRPAPLPAETGWIVYSVGDPRQPGRGDLYVTTLNGTPRRIIGSEGDGLEQACPAFSPDGSLLAYGERVEDSDPGDDPLASENNASIVVVALAANGVPTERLRLPAGLTDRLPCPQWAPDGTSLAFIAGDRHLEVVPLSGQAIAVPVLASSFSWTYDSSAIVVANEQSAQVVSADGTASRTLWPTQGGDRSSGVYVGFVAASPVEPVVALGATTGIALGNPTMTLRIMNYESGQVILDLPGDPDPWSMGRPAWSPDGRRLAWGNADGMVVRPIRDGETVVRRGPWVMEGAPSSVHPGSAGVSWSPGGTRLFFVGMYGRTAFTQGPTYAFVSIAAAGPANPKVLSQWTGDLYWASQDDITWGAVYE